MIPEVGGGAEGHPLGVLLNAWSAASELGTWGDGSSRVGAARVKESCHSPGKQGYKDHERESTVVVESRNGVPIRLPEERWRHIERRHPELRGQRYRVVETIAEPDLIQEGDSGELLAVRWYPRTPLTEKYLVVPYREATKDGFVLTAYFTNAIAPHRRTSWKR